MLRVAILISGSGSNMVKLVEAMQAGEINAEASLAVSNVPNAKGIEKAADLSVPVETIDHKLFERSAFEEQLHVVLTNHKIDIICLAGFMRVLSSDFIDKWADKILNIHPSLLPKYKGLNTHQRAIDAGDEEAGCSVHLVTAELDGGPVLAQARVQITAQETAESLQQKVLAEEHKIYSATLAKFVKSFAQE